MLTLTKGRFHVRLAATPQDIRASQHLRFLAFHGSSNASENDHGLDQDAFDDQCDHVLIEDYTTKDLVCSFRIKTFSTGRDIGNSYSAQFYDLSLLTDFDAPMVEVGRFCVHPSVADPNVLRIAWGALTQLVDAQGIELLFGCSSFHGVDTDLYADVFSILREKHLAPKKWLPEIKADGVFDYSTIGGQVGDRKAAMRLMPPLLKTYLMMGGWVSDHAVIDRQLNTLHLFTGVEVSAIPLVRKRLLRALVDAPA